MVLAAHAFAHFIASSSCIDLRVTLREAFTIIFRALRFEAIAALIHLRPFFVEVPGDRLVLLCLDINGLLGLWVVVALEGLHEVSLHFLLAFAVWLFLVFWGFLRWVAGLMMEQVKDSLAFV